MTRDRVGRRVRPRGRRGTPRLRSAPLPAALALLLACSVPPDGRDAPAGGPPRLDAPATFAGRLPCADCPGIELTVTLLADGTFRLRQVRLGEAPPTPVHDLGTWVEESPGSLVLRGSEAPWRLRAFDGDSLRVVDAGGGTIDPEGAPTLVRSQALDPVDDVQPLRGMYAPAAGGARFTECRTGSPFRVAPEGDAPALHEAYLDAGPPAGEPLLVTLRGRLLRRPATQGGDLDVLVIEGFERAWPGVGCEGAPVDRPLEGVEWVLLELPGAPPVPEGVRATLRLDAESGRAAGSTGCSGWGGSYDTAGTRLQIGVGEVTRMACADPASRVERDYLEALRVTGSFRVIGDRLELLGESGVVARFEARGPSA